MSRFVWVGIGNLAVFLMITGVLHRQLDGSRGEDLIPLGAAILTIPAMVLWLPPLTGVWRLVHGAAGAGQAELAAFNLLAMVVMLVFAVSGLDDAQNGGEILLFLLGGVGYGAIAAALLTQRASSRNRVLGVFSLLAAVLWAVVCFSGEQWGPFAGLPGSILCSLLAWMLLARPSATSPARGPEPN